MRYLRTNTAVRLTVGPFLDKADGITPEVALTVTSEKLTLMVDTGDVPTLVLDVAPTASAGANDMVHVTNDDAGFYDLELAAANVNYLGRAILAITDVATHLPVFHEFMILPAVVYDAMVLGSDLFDVSVTQFAGSAVVQSGGRPEVNTSHWGGTAIASANVLIDGAITAAKIATDAFTAAKFAADFLTAAKVAADVGTEIGTAVWATTTRLLTAGTNIALAKGTGVTGFNDLSAAQVNAEADTALADYDPPTRTELTSDINSILAIIGALADAAADGDPTSADTLMQYVKQLVNTLVGTAGIPTFPAAAVPGNAVSLAESIRQIYVEAAGLDGGALLDAAGVRTAVGLASANLDTQIAAVQSDADNIQTRLPAALTGGKMESNVGSVTAGAIAAAAFAANALDAVWATTVRLLSAGTNIVLAKGTGVTGFNDLSAAAVNAEVDTALADYDGPTSAELVTEINSVQSDIAGVPTADENAQAIMRRDADLDENDAALHSLNSLVLKGVSRIVFDDTANTLTVYKTDGTTALYEQATTQGSIQPIIEAGVAVAP